MVTRFEKRKQLRNKKSLFQQKLQEARAKQKPSKKGSITDKEFDAFKKNYGYMEKQEKDKKLKEFMNKLKKQQQEKKFGIAVKKGGIAKLPKGLQAYIKKRKKK